MSPEIFVTPAWLAEQLPNPAIQLIDARLLPPGQELQRDLHDEYLAGHLPGALYFDIDSLSDCTSPYPHMLGAASCFAAALAQMGVDQHKHLVVYDQGTLFSAPRAWWMLRRAGVKQVSILAGGIEDWQQQGYALDSGPVSVPPTEFTPISPLQDVVTLNEMQQLSHTGSQQIVDARPTARFNGEVDEPRPGLKRGHIPNSINLPWTKLVTAGRLKNNSQLADEFAAAGVAIDRPIVVSCGSGVTAIVVLLALTQLGQTQVKVYDGAWSEWGSLEHLPIAP